MLEQQTIKARPWLGCAMALCLNLFASPASSAVVGIGAITRPSPPSECGALQPGEALGVGQSATSCDGRFRLVLQEDSNLVLYYGGQALWSTRTVGKKAVLLSMQSKGDLVLLDKSGHTLWHSDTNKRPGAYLALQDNGNLVVYHKGKAPWSSKTYELIPVHPPACGIIPAGSGFARGESWSSCNGEYSLRLQHDGNLVLYSASDMPLWTAATKGKGGFAVRMQNDGNLALYNRDRKKIWTSKTAGNPGARLELIDNGNMALFSSNNTALWVTHSEQVAVPTEANIREAFAQLDQVRRFNSQLNAMLAQFSAFESCRQTMKHQWDAALLSHERWVKDFPQRAQSAGLYRLDDSMDLAETDYEQRLLGTLRSCRENATGARPDPLMVQELNKKYHLSFAAINAWLDIEQATIDAKITELAQRRPWRQSLIANHNAARCGNVAQATTELVTKLNEATQKAVFYLDTNHMPQTAQRQARVAQSLLSRAMRAPAAFAEGCPNTGSHQVHATIRSLTPVAQQVESTVESMNEEELWHHFDMRMDAIDADWVAACADDADGVEFFEIEAGSEESFKRYQQCAGK